MATTDQEPGQEMDSNGIHEDTIAALSPIFLGTTKYQHEPNICNIMVTGGAGFIASWVVRHLTLTYPDAYNIISFDKVDYCASLNNTKCLEPNSNFQFVYGDITDQRAVLRCIRQYNIDTILHFAAMSHVDLSFGNSFAFTKTNVEGTHVMLEASVKLGIKRFIHVSTDEVNGESKDGDPDSLEESILAPTNPYAASKAAAEMYVNAYAKSFKLPCIIVRSNNVYGPHQYPEKIIPKFACLLSLKRPLILHGDGKNTRRYLYAGDAADAFDTILHRGQVGEIYNVDSSDEVSNKDLAMKMLGMFHISPSNSKTSTSPSDNGVGLGVGETERNEWIKHTHDRPFNDMRYAVDARKLRGLGWRQKMGLEEGLRITVDWYKRFGRTWWRDVEGVLTAFPEVASEGVTISGAKLARGPGTPLLEIGSLNRWNAATAFAAVDDNKGEKTGGPVFVSAPAANGASTRFLAVPRSEGPSNLGGSGPFGNNSSSSGGGKSKKRNRDSDGKENEDLDGNAVAKRVLLGETLDADEVLR